MSALSFLALFFDDFHFGLSRRSTFVFDFLFILMYISKVCFFSLSTSTSSGSLPFLFFLYTLLLFTYTQLREKISSLF